MASMNIKTNRKYDCICMGRSCMDLYSNDPGVPFPRIKSFNAYVGGSPTNIAVGTSKLGLNTALLTAVGEDPVGDFVLNYLANEKVDTRYIPTKPGRRTSCVILGIEPPDKFPLVYYRDNCADNALSIDDAAAVPLDETAVFVVTGTNLSRETSRSATLYAVEKARRGGAKVVLDIDFRADQWPDVRYFGSAIRSLVPLLDIVIGTEDEINAVMRIESSDVGLTHSQVSDTRVDGDTRANALVLMDGGPEVVVVKLGQHGCRVYEKGGVVNTVPGFPVKIHNILGAGDAFAAGFICGIIRGWDVKKAARLGNACGAIVVTRHGCSISMPTIDEVVAFAGNEAFNFA